MQNLAKVFQKVDNLLFLVLPRASNNYLHSSSDGNPMSLRKSIAEVSAAACSLGGSLTPCFFLLLSRAVLSNKLKGQDLAVIVGINKPDTEGTTWFFRGEEVNIHGAALFTNGRQIGTLRGEIPIPNQDQSSQNSLHLALVGINPGILTETPRA
jgi:hypothetical protein